jgi:hypothetical protein
MDTAHARDDGIRVAIEPAWRSLLSLRDPAGASHAAGPPGFGPAFVSQRMRAVRIG